MAYARLRTGPLIAFRDCSLLVFATFVLTSRLLVFCSLPREYSYYLNKIYNKKACVSVIPSFDSETFPHVLHGWFRAYHRTWHLVCLQKLKAFCVVLKEGKIKSLYTGASRGVCISQIFTKCDKFSQIFTTRKLLQNCEGWRKVVKKCEKM